MTLRFQMRREDVLAFTREYHAASPTFRRTQTRVRFMLPVLMAILWAFSTSRSGFEWTSTLIFLGGGFFWFLFYPARFVRNVERYCEKTIDEGSYSKNFGPCELTLNDSGLHSTAPSGESKFHWSAVDRCLLTDTYLFIFLNGPIGYPIPVADVGREAALAACEYVTQKIATKDEQGVTTNA